MIKQMFQLVDILKLNLGRIISDWVSHNYVAMKLKYQIVVY